MIPCEEKLRAGGAFTIKFVGQFFAGTDPVHKTLRTIAGRLRELSISYAVHDDLAMAIHGHEQSTDTVEIILTREGHAVALQQLLGNGYAPAAPESRHLRDVTTTVCIDILLTGEFPGDGKPKPITFPDPVRVFVEAAGINYVNLPNFIELKLAAGINRPGRLRDLADIQEFIKRTKLPRSLADQLHEYVRPKFLELWDNLQSEPAEQ